VGPKHVRWADTRVRPYGAHWFILRVPHPLNCKGGSGYIPPFRKQPRKDGAPVHKRRRQTLRQLRAGCFRPPVDTLLHYRLNVRQPSAR
jgi:hypothetical protein